MTVASAQAKKSSYLTRWKNLSCGLEADGSGFFRQARDGLFMSTGSRTRLPVLHQRRIKLVESQGMMSIVMRAESPAAARAGADLRTARERLGLSLDDVAFTLRIKPTHLEALEEGRISLLPGNAYALAFVRTYANAIGLDAEEMVRRFRAEATEFDRRTELVFPVPMPERGLPTGAVVMLGIVLAIGAYTGWYRLSGAGRLPAETVTAIPQRLASLAEQAQLSPPREPADAVPPRIVLADPRPPDNVASPVPPAMTFSPASAAAALPSRADDFAPMQTFSPLSAAAASLPDAPRIVLRASADSWLMVKDRSGGVLLNRVLKAGETWPVPRRADLLLTTGNAGGTDIVVDGALMPSLGGAGAVRRDLLLDADQVKDGKLTIAASAPFASARPRQ
jgi:cytoskeleton protein RodZ